MREGSTFLGTNKNSISSRRDRTKVISIDAEGPVDARAWAMIKELEKKGAPNLLRRMMNLYVDNSPGLLSHMKASLAASDPSGLYRAAHSLKSNSRYIGAYSLGDLCEQLESTSKVQGIRSRSRALVKKIEREYGRVLAVVKIELEKEER